MASRKSLKKERFILTSLVEKDFKLKYRRSILGIAWSVLNPLFMMLVMAAVFSMFLRFDSIQNYPLYLILGSVMFNYMAATTNSGMHSIIASSSLIKKIRINKMVFPIEKAVFEMVNFAISLIAVVVVMLFTQAMPTPYLLLMPLLLVYIFLFSTGIALLLSALTVFFRDIIHLWSVIITAWTYATPIFYPVSFLEPWMQEVMLYNPMYHYVTYFRDIVMWGTWPGLKENLLCLAMGVISFAIGYLVFKKTQGKFILYV